MEIFTMKAIIMFYTDKDCIRSEICIYNKVTEQINCFKYLGYYITYTNYKRY